MSRGLAAVDSELEMLAEFHVHCLSQGRRRPSMELIDSLLDERSEIADRRGTVE